MSRKPEQSAHAHGYSVGLNPPNPVRLPVKGGTRQSKEWMDGFLAGYKARKEKARGNDE